MATVTIKGMKELREKLSALPRRVEQKVSKQALEAAAAPMLADAKANAPVLTGFARDSLKVATRRTKRGFSARIQSSRGDYVGDDFYITFHELGSRHQPAKPFMRPAFDRNVHKAIDIVIAELVAGIEAATK